MPAATGMPHCPRWVPALRAMPSPGIESGRWRKADDHRSRPGAVRTPVRDAARDRRAPRRWNDPAEILRAVAGERALRWGLARTLGAADPGQDLSWRARQRQRAVEDRDLRRGTAAGPLDCELDPGARPQ